jgi:adenylate kinase
MAFLVFSKDNSLHSKTLTEKKFPFEKLAKEIHNSLVILETFTSFKVQFSDARNFPSSACQLLSIFCSSSKNLPNIFMLGKSGAGKGTLSKLLADKYGYIHVSIGDIHRAENQKGTPIGLKIKRLVSENKITSPEMAQISFMLLKKKFFEIKSDNRRCILDNFPTCLIHIPFMKEIMHIFRLHFIIVVPNISDDETLERLANRKICSLPKCGRSYNLKICPPRISEICDICGSRLMTRIDDTPEIIRNKRIPFYYANILPVIRKMSYSVETFFLNNLSKLLHDRLEIK